MEVVNIEQNDEELGVVFLEDKQQYYFDACVFATGSNRNRSTDSDRYAKNLVILTSKNDF